MPGYRIFDNGKKSLYPAASLDTYPSLLIAAHEYVCGSGDDAWLKENYAGTAAVGREAAGHRPRRQRPVRVSHERQFRLLACPRRSGVAGQPEQLVGHHRLRARGRLRQRAGLPRPGRHGGVGRPAGQNADAARFRTAADKLRDAYFKTFYNPATGVLAGWRSADGQLHDYYFLFVNGIAIHYGLVEKDRANAIMDRLLAKMKEVGYTRFDLGLPGNLIPVARKDYVRLDRDHGGGQQEDNSDGFQIYENGGATACFAYFTLAALYDLGRREEADRILFPLLDAIEKGGFCGHGPNGRSNDWRAWDGTPWGYEGFLGDNYYALLAVLLRQSNAVGRAERRPARRR